MPKIGKAMQGQQLEEFIQDVLTTIHANIRDLEEERAFADSEEHDYLGGRNLQSLITPQSPEGDFVCA